ncbi:hypothetical protein Tco_1075005 [Tanacetum coccineum]
MDRRCAAFENGISESFNRAILSPRINLEDSITPSIRKRLKVLKEKQRHWFVFPSGFQELEVRNGDESYGVNLQHKRRLVPRLTISGGTQDAGNGNAALQNLDEDVDGSKRRCIRQPDTTRPLEVVCFADS